MEVTIHVPPPPDELADGIVKGFWRNHHHAFDSGYQQPSTAIREIRSQRSTQNCGLMFPAGIRVDFEDWSDRS